MIRHNGLARIHARSRVHAGALLTGFCPAAPQSDDHEARIRLYQERAEAGLDVFTGQPLPRFVFRDHVAEHGTSAEAWWPLHHLPDRPASYVKSA